VGVQGPVADGREHGDERDTGHREDGELAESPISRFYPGFWDYLPAE